MTGANKLDEANQSDPPGIVRVDRQVRPVGWARRQDLLLYSPAWMSYANRPEPENGHEPVALYTRDQFDAAVIAERDRCAMECWYLVQQYLNDPDDDGVEHWLRQAEQAIRARGPNV